MQINMNSGAISKLKAPLPNIANNPPIRTQNPFEILAGPNLTLTEEPPFQFSTDDGWDFFKKPTKKSDKKIKSTSHSHTSNPKGQAGAEESPSNTIKDQQPSKITNSQTNLDNRTNPSTERPNPPPQKKIPYKPKPTWKPQINNQKYPYKI